MINILRKTFGAFGILIFLTFLVVAFFDNSGTSGYTAQPIVKFVANLAFVFWILTSLFAFVLLINEEPTRGYTLNVVSILSEIITFVVVTYGFSPISSEITEKAVTGLVFGDIVFFSLVFLWPIILLIDIALTEIYLAIKKMDTLD